MLATKLQWFDHNLQNQPFLHSINFVMFNLSTVVKVWTMLYKFLDIAFKIQQKKHTYIYVKSTFMSSVPLCEMYLYVKCTFI